MSDHISPDVYQSCKEHDFNRNERINGQSLSKNNEENILFNFNLNWFSQSGLYDLSEKRQKRFFEWFWNFHAVSDFSIIL